MRAPFLPRGSLAIWTMISWPCFSMSAMSCGRRGCVRWPWLRRGPAADGDRARRGGPGRGHGRVRRGVPGAACGRGNHCCACGLPGCALRRIALSGCGSNCFRPRLIRNWLRAAFCVPPSFLPMLADFGFSPPFSGGAIMPSVSATSSSSSSGCSSSEAASASSASAASAAAISSGTAKTRPSAARSFLRSGFGNVLGESCGFFVGQVRGSLMRGFDFGGGFGESEAAPYILS